MTPDQIRALILSLSQDIVFKYSGKAVCINPWNAQKFEIGFGDSVKTYTDIDDLMNDTFFDGKSLKDICSQIELE